MANNDYFDIKRYLTIKDKELDYNSKIGLVFHGIILSSMWVMVLYCILTALFSWIFSFPSKWILDWIDSTQIGQNPMMNMIFIFTLSINFLCLSILSIGFKLVARKGDEKKNNKWFWGLLLYNSFTMSISLCFFGLEAYILFIILFFLFLFLFIFNIFFLINLSVIARFLLLLALCLGFLYVTNMIWEPLILDSDFGYYFFAAIAFIINYEIEIMRKNIIVQQNDFDYIIDHSNRQELMTFFGKRLARFSYISLYTFWFIFINDEIGLVNFDLPDKNK